MQSSLTRSYLQLRKAIGILGVTLPVVLPLGVLILRSGDGWQPTISDYIGTIMQHVFVGILFAIGVFLYFYVGYPAEDSRPRYEFMSDDLAGNVACICALGVALFPTNSELQLVSTLHVVFATAMFLILAYFAIVLFTKSSGKIEGKKASRNTLYRACGFAILACIALIGIYEAFLSETSIAGVTPVFWLEALALWAFGIAWFVKGEGYKRLNDPG